MSFLFSKTSHHHVTGDGNIKKNKKKRSSYQPLTTTDEVNDDVDDDDLSEQKEGVFRDVEKDNSSSPGEARASSSGGGGGGGNSNNMATINRLIEIARPERRLMVFSAISMAIGSGVSLAVPYFAGRIIDLSLHQEDQEDDDDDDGGTTTSSSSPFQLLLNLLVIMTLAGMAGFFRILWQAQAGHRLVARLRRLLYRAILSQDAAYFDATPQGDLISRLSSDADLVQTAVTDQALGILRNVVIAIGAVGLLFYTSAKLALVSVAILPPIALTARFVGRNMKDRQKRVRELHAEATSRAEQALTCIRTVQQFATEQYESDQYNAAVNQAHAEGIANMKLKAVFGSTMQLVINLALLVVLGYGGRLVQTGELTPGDLTSFVMYSVMMGGNISGISTQYIDLMKAVAAAHRVFDIVDRSPPIPPPIIVESAKDETLFLTTTKTDDNRHGPSKHNADGDEKSLFEMTEVNEQTENTIKIEGEQPKAPHHNQHLFPLSVQFEDVCFAYPTRPGSKVLDKLNLTIPAGKMVALVGGSGAGKSTVASLLTRLYDPQSGTIRIGNDHTLQGMHPQDVRRKVGIVAQEPLLFPTTIEENIRYGSPNATNDDVREAARLAYVLEFTDQFPEGLETVVGPRGTQLSGGQRQRVAVARCILKNPPIVVLDESTSALDSESEYQVQKAIDTACKGRTVILIAHRMSTIRSSDLIAVLMNGRVAEMGPFDELIDEQKNGDTGTRGSFRRLMEKQLLVQQ